jgi:hypothetical protein
LRVWLAIADGTCSEAEFIGWLRTQVSPHPAP